MVGIENATLLINLVNGLQNNGFIITGFAITASAHSEAANSALGKLTGLFLLQREGWGRHFKGVQERLFKILVLFS